MNATPGHASTLRGPHNGLQWTQGRATLQHCVEHIMVYNVVRRAPAGQCTDGATTAMCPAPNSGSGMHGPTTALPPHERNDSQNQMLRCTKANTPKPMRLCTGMQPTTNPQQHCSDGAPPAMVPASGSGSGLHEPTTANVGDSDTPGHTPNVAKHTAKTNVKRT